MRFSRRDLFRTAAVATGGVAAGAVFDGTATGQRAAVQDTGQSLPPAFEALKPLGDRVKPIRAEELQARVAHAQQLMADAKPRFEALYVTPGTTLLYYTGIHWWPSERILAFLIPRQGDPLLVAPAFEEGRLHEHLWLLCIRQMHSTIARLCLGLSSVLILPFLAYCSFDEIFISHPIEDCLSDKIQGLAVVLIAQIGFGSMLWASIRPPQNSKSSDSKSFPHHPLSQSC